MLTLIVIVHQNFATCYPGKVIKKSMNLHFVSSITFNTKIRWGKGGASARVVKEDLEKNRLYVQQMIITCSGVIDDRNLGIYY